MMISFIMDMMYNMINRFKALWYVTISPNPSKLTLADMGIKDLPFRISFVSPTMLKIKDDIPTVQMEPSYYENKAELLGKVEEIMPSTVPIDVKSLEVARKFAPHAIDTILNPKTHCMNIINRSDFYEHVKSSFQDVYLTDALCNTYLRLRNPNGQELFDGDVITIRIDGSK